jgi:hypothetical protein
MRLLVVLGAGASYQCWPPNRSGGLTLPLANGLFSTEQTQDGLLNLYSLTGLAAKIRRREQANGDKFDVESELAEIRERAEKNDDLNTLQSLFKARFYLQELIQKLSEQTVTDTNGHTLYVDLLNDLKDWVEEDAQNRFVDIVTFNYDSLIDKAMATVYSHDWSQKSSEDSLTAYYKGKSIRIYKPHGSINWGRVVTSNGKDDYLYSDFNQVVGAFRDIQIEHKFLFIDPVYRGPSVKNYVPALAIPFKAKVGFDECPKPMFKGMLKAVSEAEEILAIGWKGADRHFVNEVNKNTSARQVFVVGPNAYNTEMAQVITGKRIRPVNQTFSEYIHQGTLAEYLQQLGTPPFYI